MSGAASAARYGCVTGTAQALEPILHAMLDVARGADVEDDLVAVVDEIEVLDDPRAHQLAVLQPDAHEEDGRARVDRRRHAGKLGVAALLNRQCPTRSRTTSSKRGDGTSPSG